MSATTSRMAGSSSTTRIDLTGRLFSESEQPGCHTMGHRFVGSGTAAPNFVTKLSLLLLLGLVACSGPAPTAPTPQAVVTPVPPSTPTSIPVASTALPAATSPAPAATLAPTIPAGLTARDRSVFVEARLLLAEGDYATAADRWRSLLKIPAAAAEARFSLAVALSLAGIGPHPLPIPRSTGPRPRQSATP